MALMPWLFFVVILGKGQNLGRNTLLHMTNILSMFFQLDNVHNILQCFLTSPDNCLVQFLTQVNNKLICIAKDVNCSEPSAPGLLLLSNCNLLLC